MTAPCSTRAGAGSVSRCQFCAGSAGWSLLRARREG
jgi:hypothetical protein